MKTTTLLCSCFCSLLSPNLFAETLYVDPIQGSDLSCGTEAQPLATLKQAAKVVNTHPEGKGSVIRLKPGIYYLDSTVEFANDRVYTRDDRLVIEAAINPGDAGWTPAKMPIIFSQQCPSTYYFDDRKVTWSLKFEVNHVTVRGLKFLGNPTPMNRHSAIRRHGKNLRDLLVTQCLFVGDMEALPLHLGVISNGHETVIDHCIFYGCQNSVVFWDSEGNSSTGNAMQYCIVANNQTSAVWTCMTADDFQFHHNIVSNCNYFWMRQPYNQEIYTISNCIITQSKHYSGYWQLPNNQPADYKYHELDVIKAGEVQLELSTHRIPLNVGPSYLHPTPGTLGFDLGAGLFE